MKIFVSYPSEERTATEEIVIALRQAGYDVFFDRDQLPAGDDYHQRIKAEVDGADLYLFVITPQALAPGRYTLTELGYAQKRWPRPARHVLPVLLRPTPLAEVPPFLRAVTIEQPRGNVAAEVLQAVRGLAAPPAEEAARGAAGHRKLVFAGAGAGLAAVLAVAIGMKLLSRPADPAAAPIAAVPVPNPIQLRVAYAAGDDGPVELDKRQLRADVLVNRRVFTENMALQDGGYFSLNTAFPDEGGRIEGTVARPLRHSALATPPPASPLCLRRPTALEAFSDAFVSVNCTEGAACALHQTSPRWLEACDAAPRRTGALARPLEWLASAHAAPATGAERRWSVPSARTLMAHRAQATGVGFTLFDIQTDAFRDPRVYAVEVEVLANGVPIDEDGLAPAQRPVPNDATGPWRHRFALESLDFSGVHAGCEQIRLRLRPRLADGSRGEALTATVAYVALRDKAEASVPLGTGATLRWSASYEFPVHEWSHLAFAGSETYEVGGGDAAAAAARQRIVERKQAFDKLGLAHRGQRLVGVIRPPLTLTARRLAYGLAAGVVQSSGQIRFTFSYDEAQALADTLLAARRERADAVRVIDRERYIFNPTGNAQRRATPTPPGVCSHVAAG